MKMSKRTTICLLTFVLLLLLTACGAKESEVEILTELPTTPQIEITPKPEDEKVQQEEIKDIECVDKELYVNQYNGTGIKLRIPKEYENKISVKTNDDGNKIFICHQETNWVLFTITIKEYQGTLKENEVLKGNYRCKFILGTKANELSEFGAEINKMMSYAQEMFDSAEFIELPKIEIPETPDVSETEDEVIDNTTPNN